MPSICAIIRKSPLNIKISVQIIIDKLPDSSCASEEYAHSATIYYYHKRLFAVNQVIQAIAS